MSTEVETMFYTREKLWHGLGTRVGDVLGSREALELAGLGWQVVRRPIAATDGQATFDFKASIRNTNSRVLGVVIDRYKVIQNEDAFTSADQLSGEGVTYGTASSLQSGRCIWLFARLLRRYIASGDGITPYIVLINTHDGTGAIWVAVTLVRIIYMNTLDLALSTAKRP